jgi:hypothetical protein
MATLIPRERKFRGRAPLSATAQLPFRRERAVGSVPAFQQTVALELSYFNLMIAIFLMRPMELQKSWS